MELGPPVSKSRHSGGARGGSREDVLGRRAMPPRRGRRDGRARNPPAIAPRSLRAGTSVAFDPSRLGWRGLAKKAPSRSSDPQAEPRASTDVTEREILAHQRSPDDYLRVPLANVRNFSIVAHVDHGKSTLADRLLEITGAILRAAGSSTSIGSRWSARGITVKAQSVSLLHADERTGQYLPNLIDTPGTPTSRSRSRSLAAMPRSAAAGRRGAGHPGADDRDVLPGDGARPGDRAGGQQDRQRQRRRGGHGRTVGERLRLIDAKELVPSRPRLGQASTRCSVR